MNVVYSEVNLEILRGLWNQSMEVQDACNGTAVASGMHEMMKKLMVVYRNTEQVNMHPITKMWLLKMFDLAGVSLRIGTYSSIIDEWHELEQDFVNNMAQAEIAKAELEDTK